MSRFFKKIISVFLAVAIIATGVSLTSATVMADDSDFVVDLDGTLSKYIGLGGDIVIPSTVKKIGHNVFESKKNIYSVKIPKSVTVIEDSAFKNCYMLTKVTIEKGVKEICNSAFYGCRELTDINIPSSVTTIGYGAFASCNKLNGIEIPSSVNTIDNYAIGMVNEFSSYIPVVGFVIYSAGNAVAKAYAEKYDLPYISKKSLSVSAKELRSLKKKTARLSWKTNEYADKYEIQYADNSKFAKKKSKIAKGQEAYAYTNSKLSSGTTYYFRLRAIKNIAGKNYYSAWSKVKSVKVK